MVVELGVVSEDGVEMPSHLARVAAEVSGLAIDPIVNVAVIVEVAAQDERTCSDRVVPSSDQVCRAALGLMGTSTHTHTHT